MSNKTRLQTNNTSLQSLIEKANVLPDAGSSGGGNVETCRVSWLGPGNIPSMHLLKYKENAFNVYTIYNNDSIYEDDVVKGSIAVIILDESDQLDLEYGITLLGDYNPVYVLGINEDCQFSFSPAWGPLPPSGGQE